MSEAEKARKEALGRQSNWDGQYHVRGYSGWFTDGFDAGWNARDGEVADLKARLAETEAIIEKVREAWEKPTGWVQFGEAVRAILDSHRPSVLEAHDLALAKRAWDEGWAEGHDPHNGSVNPYGSGTEGKDQ